MERQPAQSAALQIRLGELASENVIMLADKGSG